jgi:hypothetical protein
MTVFEEITEMVNRETQAWNTKDSELLMTIWHPDMVWPWPDSSTKHDPIDWSLEWGRFDYDRWKSGWQQIFDEFDLIKNDRVIQKIEISREEDGAFAVVDIDTQWQHKETGRVDMWKGRVCKVYSKVEDEWKCIMHTPALDYSVVNLATEDTTSSI